MSPRHETVYVHYKEHAVMNLKITLTSHDLVDNHCHYAMIHAQVRLELYIITQSKNIAMVK